MSGPVRYRMVVAIDLTEYAEIVLEHALDQAARHAAPDLHFLTVVGNTSPEAVDRAKHDLAQLVVDGLETFRELAGAWHSRLHVRAGRPGEEIVALAGEIEADLVVVGRFGAHERHGSLATRIVEAAPCPTLVVGLTEHAVDVPPQCPDCMRVRAESDGERWFCERHGADRVTLATTTLPTTIWTGGTLLW